MCLLRYHAKDNTGPAAIEQRGENDEDQEPVDGETGGKNTQPRFEKAEHMKVGNIVVKEADKKIE